MTETRAARRRRIRAYGGRSGSPRGCPGGADLPGPAPPGRAGGQFLQSHPRWPSSPPSGFSLRWYAAVLTSPDWLVSIQLSVLVAVLTIPSVVILATLTAYGLHRGGRPQAAAHQLLHVPPADRLGGDGRTGPAHLPAGGRGVLNTVTGLWLAHTLVTLPFAIRTVSISVQALDPMLERAGQSLGAGPLRVFFTVTLPQLRPGIIAGGIFAGVLSLGEVAVSTFVSGPQHDDRSTADHVGGAVRTRPVCRGGVHSADGAQRGGHGGAVEVGRSVQSLLRLRLGELAGRQ